MADPNLEECPNFESATFHEIQEVMMATLDIDLEQAVARLCTAWNDDHQCREEEAQQRENQHRQDQDPAPRPDEEGQNNECHDAECKKPQMANFTIGRPPPSILVNRPSQYATLTSCDYVKLWYFSPEGCNNMAKHARLNADNTFGIS
ncbi:hypothetical protein BKA82DRAFT_43378, partial [Pisolithus tinctorius]